MVIAVLGILKAGGAYVPLDFDYPRMRLEFMLKDTGHFACDHHALSEAAP